MEHKKTHYYTLLKVTPYVKEYLMNNFKIKINNHPYAVSLARDQVLRRVLYAMIQNPSHRYDKRNFGYKYTCRNCEVAIVVSDRLVSSSGWLLSETDASDFALLLERRCHALMISYINMRMIFCSTLKECILQFQKQFHFTEDTWSYDTIRRIWNRDKTFDRYGFRKFVENEINKIYLVQMKRTGLLFNQLDQIDYEKNS